jgi:transcription antitermination factor NusG
MESWFVFYTYPKAEKWVYKLLVEAGFETYLPLQEQVRQWHDRKKKLQIPLFPNYIFVKVSIIKIYEVLKFPRVVRCIKFNNKPSQVREDEIDLIRNVERNYTNIIVSNKLERGERVTIQGGPLDGVTGIIEESRNSRHVVININSISYSLKVSLTPHEVAYAMI